MKHLITLMLLFSMATAYATGNDNRTIREQLVELNKFWKDKQIDASILEQRGTFANDDHLIQLHLFLVEQTLRNNPPQGLSEQQLTNRNACLDILQRYAIRGKFPRNLYHPGVRQPYFIDHLGTACAVGYLVIETGYGDYAQSIHDRDNYVFIMDIKDKELDDWANKYGFAKEELAWIQPGYPCVHTCSEGTFQNPSCYGTSTGCASPDYSSINGNPPYTTEGYIWQDTGWVQYWSMTGIMCDLRAGSYKYVVTDMANSHWDFFYTLTDPDSIEPHASIAPDNGTCNGSISVAPEKGQAPYTYQWYGQGGNLGITTSSATGLCPGDYWVYITDATGCTKYNTYKVDQVNSVPNTERSEVKVYPNPVNHLLNVEVSKDITHITCTNVLGDVVNTPVSKAAKGYTVNTENIAPGVYYLTLQSGTYKVTLKFVKE